MLSTPQTPAVPRPGRCGSTGGTWQRRYDRDGHRRVGGSDALRNGGVGESDGPTAKGGARHHRRARCDGGAGRNDALVATGGTGAAAPQAPRDRGKSRDRGRTGTAGTTRTGVRPDAGAPAPAARLAPRNNWNRGRCRGRCRHRRAVTTWPSSPWTSGFPVSATSTVCLPT